MYWNQMRFVLEARYNVIAFNSLMGGHHLPIRGQGSHLSLYGVSSLSLAQGLTAASSGLVSTQKWLSGPWVLLRAGPS